MRTVIDDYGYIYPKLSYLKGLIMDEEERKKISSFSDIPSLINYSQRYFPDLSPRDDTLIAFERNLWKTFFKIFEKILVYSPAIIQKFLKVVLLRFEIWNIKTAITKILVGGKVPEDSFYLYIKPQQILEKIDFLNKLKNAENLEDIKKLFKDTKYEEVVKDGIEVFNQNSQLFFLEQGLDHFYYNHIYEKISYFKNKRQELIVDYLKFILDYYNVNLFMRSIYNDISPEAISDYIIKEGYYLKEENFQDFRACHSLSEFFDKLEDVFEGKKEIYYKFFDRLQNPSLSAKDLILTLIDEILIKEFKENTDIDLKTETITNIVKIVVNKEKEINLLVKRAVEIDLEKGKMI